MMIEEEETKTLPLQLIALAPVDEEEAPAGAAAVQVLSPEKIERSAETRKAFEVVKYLVFACACVPLFLVQIENRVAIQRKRGKDQGMNIINEETGLSLSSSLSSQPQPQPQINVREKRQFMFCLCAILCSSAFNSLLFFPKGQIIYGNYNPTMVMVMSMTLYSCISLMLSNVVQTRVLKMFQEEGSRTDVENMFKSGLVSMKHVSKLFNSSGRKKEALVEPFSYDGSKNGSLVYADWVEIMKWTACSCGMGIIANLILNGILPVHHAAPVLGRDPTLFVISSNLFPLLVWYICTGSTLVQIVYGNNEKIMALCTDLCNNAQLSERISKLTTLSKGQIGRSKGQISRSYVSVKNSMNKAMKKSKSKATEAIRAAKLPLEEVQDQSGNMRNRKIPKSEG